MAQVGEPVLDMTGIGKTFGGVTALTGVDFTLRRGEDPDHCADRVADEDDVAEVELVADLQHVLRVTLQRGVPLRIEGGGV